MSGASASSIVELSRSRSRYHDQDALLRGFVSMPGSTAKEVAVEVLDWRYEQYANAPKRAHDLHLLGYLERLDGRECRHTGKVAHTYRVTDAGLAHLRGLGVDVAAPVVKPAAVNEAAAKTALSDLRKILG
jgi:transposase